MTITFNQACDMVGYGKDLTTLLRDLYTEPHRFYHNLDHIENMLSLSEGEGTLDSKMIKTILFHDAVWYPQSKYNETLSASLFVSEDPEAPVVTVDIYNAIIASSDHLDDDNEHAPSWVHNFLDYDLAGFANKKSFDLNTIKIYREASKVFTDEEIINGRKAFLVEHLAHKRMFWRHPQWEEPARQNIYHDLQAMEKVDDYLEWIHCEVSDMISKEMENSKNEERV